jgi:flagella basal body P-ring formation protein FlgA
MLPVPAVTLYPGDEITRATLSEKFFYFDPDRPLPVVEDPRRLLGKVARRTLVAGKPVPRHGIAEPDLVARGRPVEARFRRPGLVLSTTVVPLADGAAGEWVRARNPQTGRVVEGVVTRAGTLVVSPRRGADGGHAAPADGDPRP